MNAPNGWIANRINEFFWDGYRKGFSHGYWTGAISAAFVVFLLCYLVGVYIPG